MTNSQKSYLTPSFLAEGKKLVEKPLYKLITNDFNKLRKKWPYISNLLPPLEKYLKRNGKRIRPILTILTYRGFSGSNDNKIILPSLGTEFLHAAFLVHDDLYDDMPGLIATRGGERVLHNLYYDKFSKYGFEIDSNWEPKLFSRYAAFAMEHILLTLGSETIQSSSFPSDIKNKAMSVYWDTIQEGIVGQGIDILSKSKVISKVSDKEVVALELARSACYTIKFPLTLGAVFAGVDANQLAVLSSYAYKVGLAYQIHDDIMGMFGNAAETGKVQSELTEGKRTLLIQKTLEIASKASSQELVMILKSKKHTHNNVEKARKIIIDSGAFDEVVKISQRLISDAKKEVPKLRSSKLFKNQLFELADFVMNRNK